MIPRPDLRDPATAAQLEVYQLTTRTDLPGTHVYMEAQVFTPDSRRLVLHESAHAHGSDARDPRHRYLLCDLANGGALTPLTDETGVTGPSLSPDGAYLYYLVDETTINGGRLTLKRVRLDGTGRETLQVLDSPLPGTRARVSRPYPLSTIRSDGLRLATAVYLGDGQTPDAPWGLIVFHLDRAQIDLILAGPTWCNLHPQYSRALEAPASHDILIQENHGNTCDAQGRITGLVSGEGADIHVLRDDGSRLRNLPWGRDGHEQCQGHQCWRGRTSWAITSTTTPVPGEAYLLESQPTAPYGHQGRLAPEGERNDLSRSLEGVLPGPSFYHFATDIAGARFITDTGAGDHGGRVFLARLGAPGRDPLTGWRPLARPRCSWQKGAHLHPFLSPDGKYGFFNSDESGRLQAYCIAGLDQVAG
jgi:hypothetical protein